MKKERLSFFKKLILVITDFRTYPFLVKHEKIYKSLIYLLKLTLLLTVVLTIYTISSINTIFQTLIVNYDEKIPEFELIDNKLTVEEKYSQKINNEAYLVINTDYSYEEYKNTKEYSSLVLYDMITLVNNDKITIELTSNENLEIPFEDLGYEMNKQGVYDELLKFSSDKSYKVSLYIALFISTLISYLTIILFKILMFTLIISIFCIFTGVHLNFSNYIKVAIYAYTLPLIFDVLATCFVGYGKDYTYYATLMLTYVYMIYAVRAIRLDAFIMLFSRRKHAKHSTSEFEEELQKYNEQVGNDELIEIFTKKKENDEKQDKNDNENDKKE